MSEKLNDHPNDYRGFCKKYFLEFKKRNNFFITSHKTTHIWLQKFAFKN